MPRFARNDSQFYGQSRCDGVLGYTKTRQRIRTRISRLIHSHTERDPWLQIQAVIKVQGWLSVENEFSERRQPQDDLPPGRYTRSVPGRRLTPKPDVTFPFRHLRNLRIKNSKTSSAKRILYSFASFSVFRSCQRSFQLFDGRVRDTHRRTARATDSCFRILRQQLRDLSGSVRGIPNSLEQRTICVHLYPSVAIEQLLPGERSFHGPRVIGC